MAHNWLRDRRWTDPIPDGVVIDQSGAIVGFEHNEPSRPMGFIDIGEAMARDAEDRERERRVAADRELLR